MMRKSSLLLGLLLAASAFGQDRDVLVSRARQYIDSLTSPAFHGRGYVNKGDALAAEWIARQYERIGLKPVKEDYFQPFAFNVNTFPDSVSVTLDGVRLVPGIDFLVDPGSGSAEGTFDLVHVVPEDLYSPERKAMTMGVIAGKAACLHLPSTTNADTLQLFATWERDLMHRVPVVKPISGKLTWGVSKEAHPYPLIEVTANAVTDSSVTVTLNVRNTMRARHQARNVLGMIKGGSKRWVVVTAHYDHLGRMGSDALFPGANDNASGVAMLLSLAEWFSRNKPKDNLLFVAFAGEEAGLMGSEWCVVDRPIDWGDARMLINLDILGTGDEGIMVVNATQEKAAYERLLSINTKRGYLAQVKARGPACNSDHCPFVKRGIPGIFIYTLGGVSHYHDVLDRPETLPLTEFADLHALLRDFINSVK